MKSDKAIFINGVFWNAIQKYSGLVVSLLVTMVLARLLSPNEFGMIAIALVIISFLTMLCDMGISPAIVQRQDLSEQELDSIYSFTVYVGMLVALIFSLSSGLIARIYDEPTLKYICRFLSIVVFFSSINMVPNALMNKSFKFEQIAKRTLLLQVASGSLSIGAAFYGLGVYSLLISPIFTAVGVYLYNRKFYKLRFLGHFSLIPLRKIFSYSAFQFLFKFVNFFAANIDKLIIGRTITTEQLGQYQKAFQLVQLPLSNVDSVVSPILHPLLAKYQDDKFELISRYHKIILLLASIGIPMGVAMFFCGKEIITWFYGNQWTMAIPSFRIMAIGAPFYMIISCCGSFFQAANETKKLFYLGLINGIIMICCITFAAVYFRTIESVALAWSLSILSNFSWTYFFIYRKILNLKMSYGLKLFIRPLIFGLIQVVLLYSVNIFCGQYIVLSFIIKVSCSIVIVIALLFTTKQIDYIKSLVLRK